MCSGDEPDAGSAPDEPVTSASLAIGAGGGTLELTGLTVTIAPGALTETTTITAEAIDADLSVGAIGTWYILGPPNTALNAPVTVEIEVDADDVETGDTPFMVRPLQRSDRSGGDEVTVSLRLDTTWDPDEGKATARVGELSRIGLANLNCASVPALPAVTATWDGCARTTALSWTGEGAFFVEYGALADDSPVDWFWGQAVEAMTTLEVSAAVDAPPSDEPPLTWAFRVQPGLTCETQTFYAQNTEVVTVTAEEVRPPNPPQNLVAQRTEFDEVTVRWSASSSPQAEAEGYEVSRTPPFTNGQDVTLGLVTEYKDRDVEATGNYLYGVRAFRPACGQSLGSELVSASTSESPAPPDDLEGLSATPLSPTAIRLEWSLAARAAEYVVSRSGGGSTFDDVVVAAPTQAYIDRRVSPNNTYVYSVTPRNQDGEGAPETTMASTPMPGSNFETTCGDLRLTVMPQTIITTVQRGDCTPGEVGCPNDAAFQLLVEWLNGATADVNLSARIADESARVVIDSNLGAFGGRGGSATEGVLTGGVASRNTTYEIRTPESVLAQATLPLVWNLLIGGALVDGPQCVVPIELTVRP